MLPGVEITYLGHASFRLRGRTATVVTDPYNDKCGKFPRDTTADMVTISHGHGDHNQKDKVGGSPFVVEGPGEYEVKGVSVIGVPTFHDDKGGAERGTNTAYVIEMDGMRLLHLGDLGHKLSEGLLSEIGAIDLCFVPTGGVYTVDAKTAAEGVRQVDPWVAVPMHYQQAGLDAEMFGQLAPVTEFLKEMGKDGVQAVAKLTISADRLPTELLVVVLERK